MQKKIELVEGTQDDAIFTIEQFSFVKTEMNKKRMILYPIEIGLEGYSPLDVRYLFEEINDKMNFLIQTPEEVTEYIKKYEENSMPDDECLFHDIRTRYIDFAKYETKSSSTLNPNEKIIILGFTILKDKLYLVIKTFSIDTLSDFTEILLEYCAKNDISYVARNNIRWVKLEQYILPDKNVKNDILYEDFLKRTLRKGNFNNFIEIFKKIDMDGFFNKKFYDIVMYQEITTADGETRRVPINQIIKFFFPFWKTDINLNGKNKTILCLHDEMPNDGKINDYVYTFKPHLMQYYLQNWFEDFSVKIIEDMNLMPFKIIGIYAGRQFNFYFDGDGNNIREIDVVVGVEYEGIFKMIAIECKKTLSNKEIQMTNKKCKEKVMQSGNNVFDAFVHIGCFNNDVILDKQIEGKREKYKQGILGVPEMENVTDVPFYAFSISSIEDYEMKIKYIIEDIFKNW